MFPTKTTAKGFVPEVAIKPLDEEPVQEFKLDGKAVRQIIGNPERFKYEAAWSNEDYRKFSPGEQVVPIFLDTCKPARGDTLVDWGAGTGRAGHSLWKHHGLNVTMVDFVEHCLDDAVQQDVNGDSLKFVKHDLTEPTDLRATYGYCCDVLEHVPEDEVDAVLSTIVTNCNEVFFQIATVEDHFGDELGNGPLHVTVRPYSWWLKKFADMNLIVLHSNEFQNHVLFHVSGMRNFWWTRGGLNNDVEVIHSQIKQNSDHGVMQLEPMGKGKATLREDDEEPTVLFLAGGPSLNDHLDEIKEKRAKGYPLVTCNNTFNWALDNGLEPSLQFMIDSREFNKRFVEREAEAPHCKYVIASQCHPSVFEELPKDRTYMWHISLEDDDIELTKDYYGEMYKDWFPVPGGCSVTLRALCALQMIGFRKVELYGFDSCLREDEHHAYDQEENDTESIIEVRVAKGTKHERTFLCHPFMAVQAKEFERLTPLYFKNMDLVIHGDGLISHIVNTGASISAASEKR